MPDADLGFVDSLEYFEHANSETFVVVQIEDAEALDNLDDIMSTDGIDCIFIGPADLSLSLGVPLQFGSQKYKDAEDAIAKAAERNGKWWGRPVGDAATAAIYAERGARFFNLGGDYGLLLGGFKAYRKDFDEIVNAVL